MPIQTFFRKQRFPGHIRAKRRLFGTLLVLAFGVLVGAAAGAEVGLSVWPVNAHVKVFRDTPAGAAGAIGLRAARNEYEPGQLAVRARAPSRACAWSFRRFGRRRERGRSGPSICRGTSRGSFP